MDKKNNKIEEPDMDLEFSTCSSYDCTGLIPTETNLDDAVENYEELYPFLPPTVEPKEEQ
ncbi:MAG: hypothetical protein MSH11_01195 [Ruminococcus sp.]|nr:hypothetical protein [Ruminococcus sp.]